jgi:hypothetical protein
MDVPLDQHRAYHARITWRTTRHKRAGSAPGERDRETGFRIVKNRRFFPKAPGTDLRRSERRLAITLDLTFRTLSRVGVSS